MAEPARDRGDGLVVRDLLAMPILERAVVLAGRDGMDRPVRRLNVMTVPDILPWTKADEFMLSTGYPLPHAADELIALVTEFAARDVAAVGVKLGSSRERLPPEVLAAADRLGLPIVEIPDDVAFDDILSLVFSDIVNRQAVTIARAKEIHDAFLQIVLTGGQLPEIAAQLSGLLAEATVLVADADGRRIAMAGPEQRHRRLVELGLLGRDGRVRGRELRLGVHSPEPGLVVIIAEIRAGRLRHGHLLVAGSAERMGPDATVAVDQAAVVAALDVTRQLAISAAERQFESNVLHDLVTAGGTDIEDALARGAAFGWDLRRPLVVMVGSDGSPTSDLVRQPHIELWSAEIRNQDRGAAAAAFATNLVAIVGAGDDPAAIPHRVWAGLRATSRRKFSIGVSRPLDDPALIPARYEEARKALRMGLHSHGPGTVTLFGELGLFRLLSLIDDVDELRDFVRDTLGGLLSLDEREGGELIRTLQVLLDHHLNVAKSARALHVHYNTMRYRISKLERLVGPLMSDNRLCLRLSVALQALEMYEVRGR
ncbi:PucR family transcriptional regulator [Pseudonocardia acaciae]|uniref:PucR family transcriptional regulator n=1 Tax=Pseudonocardia acaciae TaxID=551276 RepID=UPI001FDF2C29|nr:PucR family transcriptional regulator [Pseudonocardia acaciae]